MPNLTLVPINGELRIYDLELAECLGFARPADIRKLICRHAKKLREISILATVAKIHDGAGRPTQEYYLDRKQAIFICMKSETENAIDVQMDIVRVYDNYLDKGELPTPIVSYSIPSSVNHHDIRNTFESFRSYAVGNNWYNGADK
ncbi:hypothetical protein [Chromatium okenii]|uniref:hypothetical protein n=1 Tax=Chromatium okenii TaxID=61644 RepID=UPI0026ECED2F|nr:hypothetical protein [Chromatium okenii]MBV5310503.1 hypothetical protein [Chromatium okenii]